MRLECVRVQRRTKAGSLALLLARSYQFAVAYGLPHLFFGGGVAVQIPGPMLIPRDLLRRCQRPAGRRHKEPECKFRPLSSHTHTCTCAHTHTHSLTHSHTHVYSHCACAADQRAPRVWRVCERADTEDRSQCRRHGPPHEFWERKPCVQWW